LDVGPLLDPIEVLQRLIERTAAVHLVGWYVLNNYALGNAGRHWQFAVADIVPVDLCLREEHMLFDLLRVPFA
jgi:hypothetical protein